MKTYVQFFNCFGGGRLIEACGDRSIIKIDGRLSRLNQEKIAEEECRKRKYDGWQLIKGFSLLRAKPVTPVVSLFY